MHPVFEYKDGFNIVKLISEDSYKREGKLMSHCVASYANKESEIFSLRDAKNNPHCTIEIKENEVRQIKGKGNGSISPKYVHHILEFLEFKNLKINKHDMLKLGYLALPEEILADVQLLSNFVTIKINGEIYAIRQH